MKANKGAIRCAKGGSTWHVNRVSVSNRSWSQRQLARNRKSGLRIGVKPLAFPVPAGLQHSLFWPPLHPDTLMQLEDFPIQRTTQRVRLSAFRCPSCPYFQRLEPSARRRQLPGIFWLLPESMTTTHAHLLIPPPQILLFGSPSPCGTVEE